MTSGVLLALQADPAPWPGDAGMGTVKALVALLVVFALLGGFLWALRRGAFAAAGGHQRLVVEAAVSLGDRRSLVIVGVEGRRLLLGVSPAQVTLVAELAPAAQTFGEALDRFGPTPRGGDADPAALGGRRP
jgi:flagellar biosynthetic protein FliO